MSLKIEYVPLESIKTYPNNAKVHTSEQIEQIKKSIQEFGMNDPIAVWKDNEIIEGHGRLIALTEMGYKEVPVIRLDNLTDEQRKAYMLVHNKLTMNTGFNFDLLETELMSIEDVDMSLFGFDMNDEYIESFFNEEELEAPAPKDEEYEIHSFKVTTKTKKEVKILQTFLHKQNITYTELLEDD